MTAKERRKVKHALKTSIDKADIWLKLAIDVPSNIELTNEDLKSSNSRATIVEELKKLEKDISKNFSEYILEIKKCISSLE